MKKDDLLDVAYYAIVNEALLNSNPFGEYNHLLNLLIYKGETYINTKMILYESIRNSLSHPCINLLNAVDIDFETPIFKECKQTILFKESSNNSILEGKWVRVLFDEEDYIKNYLIGDAKLQLVELDKKIANEECKILESEKKIKRENDKKVDYKNIIRYVEKKYLKKVRN